MLPEPTFDGEKTTYHFREQSVRAFKQYSKFYQANNNKKPINNNNNNNQNQYHTPQQQNQQVHGQNAHTTSSIFLRPAGPVNNNNNNHQHHRQEQQQSLQNVSPSMIPNNQSIYRFQVPCPVNNNTTRNGNFMDYNNATMGYNNNNNNLIFTQQQQQQNSNQLHNASSMIHHQISSSSSSSSQIFNNCSKSITPNEFIYPQAGLFFTLFFFKYYDYILILNNILSYKKYLVNG